MEIITIKCVSISPMFIGNANTKNAELRPAAIKASLRFWWRALHPNLSVSELKEQEAAFFGGSYRKTTDGKTTMENVLPCFRIISVSQIKVTPNIPIDPRRGKEKVTTKAIPKDITFKIEIIILKSEEAIKNKIFAIFYLASALGSLGKRARRGAGAWRITDMEYNNKIIGDNINEINTDKTINDAVKKSNTVLPYLVNYGIGDEYETETALRIKIMESAHTAKLKNLNLFNDYLGGANPRLSSPIYVSMIASEGEKVKPIITRLNFKKNSIQTDNILGLELQQDFIKAILNI